MIGRKIYSPSLDEINRKSDAPKYGILEEIEILRNGSLNSLVEPTTIRLVKTITGHEDISEHIVGPSSMNLRNHIYQVNQLWLLAVEVFNSEQSAEKWMYDEIQALNWAKPVEFLDTAPGIRWLESVLNNIKYGVYS